MPRVTVCLTNWMRPDNVVRIIEMLGRQSVGCSIFLWNNGKEFSHSKLDWVVHSSENLICWPRWFMAANAATEYVCILDDDLFFKDPEVLSDVLRISDSLPDYTIVGPTGVKLLSGKSYQEAVHLYSYRMNTDQNCTCDIIKGSMMFLRTHCLTEKVKLGSLQDYREDDIAVSALVSGAKPNHHICLTSFGNRFYSLGDDPVALWRRPGHMDRRMEACRRYFPAYFPYTENVIEICGEGLL